ncbi:glycoprotein 3-alpha-L-fucosyltransferase A-like [Watersipora subatra]|uniref:glycoprotein 3-alpha-L-fucosyltransferase A-like n=1 Tax=Watersipora subatra TaxID=2589382 RepID=UPI00355C5404
MEAKETPLQNGSMIAESSQPVTASDGDSEPIKTATSAAPKKATRIIYQPTDANDPQTRDFNKIFKRDLNFSQCALNNCDFTFSSNFSDADFADIVLVEYRSTVVEKTLRFRRRAQVWLVYSLEPPTFFPWKDIFNSFNGTMTYVRNSSIFWPFGETYSMKSEDPLLPSIAYTQGKTRGAYVYVSNCKSNGYDRIATIKELGEYVDVDVFGKCTGNQPCGRHKIECEVVKHSRYKFYLAFENSLCKDYITEKFWKRLHCNGHFVPVVVGGFSIDDYTRVAPPDSFIHAYNFSSIKELGEYLQHLMQDDAAYNRYHEWRKHYITKDIGMPQTSVCNLCKMANNASILESGRHRLAADWNHGTNCRELKLL